ncbi:SufS family cysteine desulfurase [Thalassotalea sp. PLHSN55]|uniref:SufS family cysteine desulfurase n=1 Tax=Thalassotalea sp. PLHSN55 TaxID=3435888 RepID=UPI003F877C67
MHTFEKTAFRAQFPLLKTQVNNADLVYFDNAATSQKPQTVIDAYQNYYQALNSNVHRASHAISAKSTSAYEAVREQVQKYIHASCLEQVIWTKGTTESINLIAQTWGRANLKAGDEILLSQSEHHANIVPWQIVAEQTGACIKVLPLTQTGEIDVSALERLISSKTRVVSVAHISNVIGKINPVKTIIAQAKKAGAITVIDGAQAVAHQAVNVEQLDCDFYVFSAHKMFGPTGVGVLYGKKALLEAMPVYQGGGEMIKQVSFEQTHYNQIPFKFEPGTPNIAGVIAFGAALTFLSQQDAIAMLAYEQTLTRYCYLKLQRVLGVRFICEGEPDVPLLSFTIDGHHNHDIAAALDSYGIAIRSGHHCAMPLMTYLNIGGCLRVSLAAYNTRAEVDFLITCLNEIIDSSASSEKVTVAAKTSPPENPSVLTTDEIISRFEKSKGWDQRHREIMLLGKALNRMDKSLRGESTLIHGCESLAWLSFEQQDNGCFIFSADSDAKVIRGLLMIVLTALSGKTAEQINEFDLESYFKRLGLLQHLSPSRGNGLKAIVARIKTLVNKSPD